MGREGEIAEPFGNTNIANCKETFSKRAVSDAHYLAAPDNKINKVIIPICPDVRYPMAYAHTRTETCPPTPLRHILLAGKVPYTRSQG